MLKYNPEEFIERGAKIYSLRKQVEKIARTVYEEGIKNIFFTASGGSTAVMQPFNYLMETKSSIPSYLKTAADLISTGNMQLTKDSLVISISKSGTTQETVDIFKKLHEKGIRTISFVSKNDTPLGKYSTYAINDFDGRPQEMPFYFLIGKILELNGEFDDYSEFADELKNLPNALNKTREEVDEKAKKFAEKHKESSYQIWIGSGNLWGITYSYSMCVLEESQWLRTKSVTSPEFFHGTLELTEKDLPIVLLTTEAETRVLDKRVSSFASQYTNDFTEFDTRDFSIPGISSKYRPLVSAPVMWAALGRISVYLEHLRNHSLDTRRYYRKVSY